MVVIVMQQEHGKEGPRMHGVPSCTTHSLTLTAVSLHYGHYKGMHNQLTSCAKGCFLL